MATRGGGPWRREHAAAGHAGARRAGLGAGRRGRVADAVPALQQHHKLSGQDRRFMRQAAQAGLFEVKKSELALARSHHRQVRQLAAQMIRDHTNANQELKQLAAAKEVILPRRPSAHQRMIIRRLARLYGNHFDCAYMAVQVRAHLQAIAIF